jgi:hypothetical protein
MSKRYIQTEGVTKEALTFAIDDGCDTKIWLSLRLGVSYPTITKYLNHYDLLNYLLEKKRIRVDGRIRHQYSDEAWQRRINARKTPVHSPLRAPPLDIDGTLKTVPVEEEDEPAPF